MHVPREMKVDVILRSHGSKATAGRAALDAKDRAEARFAEAKKRGLGDLAKAFGQSDRGRGFAFAGFRWGDRGYEDQLSIGLIFQFVIKAIVDLGLITSIRLNILIGNTRFFGNFRNRQQFHMFPPKYSN